jgi:Fe-S cluster assembly protein SufD
VTIADQLDGLVPATPVCDEPARRWLEANGWPSHREEAWRYAPLDAIATVAGRAHDHEEDDVAGRLATELEHLAAVHPAWAPDAARLVLVDGRPAIDWSSTPDALAAAGLVVMTGVAPEPLVTDSLTDGFEVLNQLTTPGVTVVEVTDAAQPRALHLVHLATGRHLASPSRTRLVVGRDVVFEAVETFQSVTGAGLTNARTTIEVGAAARVDHVRVVHAGREGAHVASTAIVAHDDAWTRSSTLQVGPGPVRHAVAADLVGRAATVELGGLSIPGPGGHHDTSVSVRHLASAGTSRQQFAGLVPDRARVSFGGHVVVASGTTGTDADQQSRNVLLGPHARADARPWLEINSDDVRCTHGATVGRLDDEGLFYLRTRGIGPAEARAMLLRAFVATLLDQLAAPGPTADWLAATVTDAIDDLARTTTGPDQGAARR